MSDARHMLETLRRGPDQLHIEPVFEELMWLRKMPPRLPVYPKGYITDCCAASDPCLHHREVENGECEDIYCERIGVYDVLVVNHGKSKRPLPTSPIPVCARGLDPCTEVCPSTYSCMRY